MPMRATRTRPASVRPGSSARPGLGNASVTQRSAGATTPSTCPVSAQSPDGRSTATTRSRSGCAERLAAIRRMLAAAAPSTGRDEARPEDRVHDHAQRGRAPTLALDRHADRTRPPQARGGVAAQRCGAREQRRAHRNAEQLEVTRRHQAIAAVVAAAADDQHAPARRQHAEHRLGDGAPGALHQQLARHAQRLDRVAIELAHLLCGGERPAAGGREAHAISAFRSRTVRSSPTSTARAIAARPIATLSTAGRGLEQLAQHAEAEPAAEPDAEPQLRREPHRVGELLDLGAALGGRQIHERSRVELDAAHAFAVGDLHGLEVGRDRDAAR